MTPWVAVEGTPYVCPQADLGHIISMTMHGTEAERLAISRLHAAAPELLALAVAFEAWEARVIFEGDWREECVTLTPDLHEAWLQLAAQRNAAIAKATGTPTAEGRSPHGNSGRKQ